ncbi:MAG: exodeoxyribonuclease VII large subunit [Rhodoluna sp.]|nr:exodeoxyribonuclease VII large subunit [Rhodoluna sp.]
MSEDQQQQSSESRVSSELSPWSVSNFTSSLKDWITKLGNVWVEGQISQISPKKDVFFGELRDLVADKGFSIHSRRPDVLNTISELAAGDRVVALVHPDFWERSGKTSMDVLAIRKVGLGELLERIERLRQQLIKEGLTLAERKQPLPFLPNLIGLITGANSDAEKDVLQNAKLRWPEVRFKIQHTPVQGDKAAAEIIKAIQALDADSEVDVIILTRGGGSFQDLLVFSDEQVVRAVANCKTPIVSAIGHENDRPLTDEVADFRASTPTDAAKNVVPDVVDERKKISIALERIALRVVGYVQNQLELIAGIRTRPVFANPFTIVDERSSNITQLLTTLQSQTKNFLDKEQLQIAGLRGQVRALSPKLTLDRGYAVVRNLKDGLVTDPKKVSKGEKLKVSLAGGDLGVTAD